MKINFPSREFDDAVAGVCHGVVSEEQARALNVLLRENLAARDEYILRVELHARLASHPDLFISSSATAELPDRATALSAHVARHDRNPATPPRAFSPRLFRWALALAAAFAVFAAVEWSRRSRTAEPSSAAATSKAVALLDVVANAQWAGADAPRLHAPLDPGWLKLDGGLIQVVFYSGARVVVEGPAEFELVSASRAYCRRGKLMAEVPPEARGFRVDTPQGGVTDLGTSFGVEVAERGMELHVFNGSVTLQPAGQSTNELMHEGEGVKLEASRPPRLIAANPSAYVSLFNVAEKSVAAETRRVERWRAQSDQLNREPALRVRFDFEHLGSLAWQLRNVAGAADDTDVATIVGCQFTHGRWPEKRAIEFQNVSDRVRLNVPGEFESITLAAWIRVQGLDRTLNSLFMCDGFNPGSLHWLIRNDGVLGLTIVGPRRGTDQILITDPVVTLDKLGTWIHLAVAIDGRRGRAVQYVNGRPVAQFGLRIGPPYRVGPAELGNWNGDPLLENSPYLIRNFSGAMDDFCLFARALDAREVQMLYAEGKPEMSGPRTAMTAKSQKNL